MSVASVKHVLAAGVAAVVLSGATALTQGEVADPASKPLPNPNPKVIKNFGTLPDGRMWGNTAGVDIGPDGQLWAYDRCGTNSCAGSNVDPIVKFDRNSGKLLASFGRGQFIFPHGIHVDRDGNVWVTDGRAANKEELAKFPDATGQGPHGDEVQPRRQGAAAARQTGRGAARHRYVQRAERRDHRAQRRHLRLRRPQRPEPDRDPRHQRPHREVHARRQVRQGVGQVRLRARRVPDAACAGDGFARPAVRRRSRQPPDPDLRPGRQVPRGVEAVQPGQRAVHHAATTCSTRSTRSRAPSGTRTGRPACASARRRKTRCCSSSRRTRCRQGAAQGAAGEGVAVDRRRQRLRRRRARSRARRPAAD